MKNDNSCVPRMPVSALVRELAGIYGKLIKRKLPISVIPPVMLWGPPGVGKSQAVREIGAALEADTGKKVKITDVRLLLFSPIDLRGIPAADAERSFTVWLKPKIFDMDPSEKLIHILFLDELSAAPQSVQAAAYQITLDRVIGEHKLPDNCIVMAAGNRTTDRGVAFKMPGPLANRLQHYELSTDFGDWKDWAIEQDMHPDVLGYLAFDRTKLCPEEPPLDRLAFPSPRMWEKVSGLLKLLEEDHSPEELYCQIGACVGTDTAIAFLAWCAGQKELPQAEDIFCGRKAKLPATPDSLFALIGSLVRYVKERAGSERGPVSETELGNLAAYASHFPEDYQACLYHQLDRIPGTAVTMQRMKLYLAHRKKTGAAARI